jgi:hypothetical protein
MTTTEDTTLPTLYAAMSDLGADAYKVRTGWNLNIPTWDRGPFAIRLTKDNGTIEWLDLEVTSTGQKIERENRIALMVSLVNYWAPVGYVTDVLVTA